MADARAILHRAMRAARATIVVEDDIAYTRDPVFHGLERNRVNAELLKAALRLPASEADALGFDAEIRRKLASRLLSAQRASGAWHEIHPKYDEPSALATAFMAEALEAALGAPGMHALEAAIHTSLGRARDYVLAAERRPGYFVKSERYLADHLNVDASIAAFLAAHAVRAKDQTAEAAARRAMQNVVRWQFEDGAYPYTTDEDGPPYEHPIHVPCIHYQGVTGYYLAKARDKLPSPEVDASLLRAARWLASVQRPDGRFDWSKSHMMFALYLSGAYAFGAALFADAAKRDSRFAQNAEHALGALDRAVPHLALRWEPASLASAFVAPIGGWRSGWHRAFPPKHNLLRVGYGTYRELARRRRSERAEDCMFHALRKTFRLRASTVDPSANYPDLFITAEVVDCLARLHTWPEAGS